MNQKLYTQVPEKPKNRLFSVGGLNDCDHSYSRHYGPGLIYAISLGILNIFVSKQALSIVGLELQWGSEYNLKKRLDAKWSGIWMPVE